MFEIGKIFTNKEEKKELIVALTGKQKNLLEIKDEIITELNLTDFPCKIYMLEQKILDYYKIRRPIHILEADLSKIFSQLPESSELYKIDDKKVIFKPISKFPPVIRDLAFIIDKKIPAKEIISEITKIDKNVFIVDLFDEFESKKFGVNMKNIAFHVWYNSLEKTLPEKEINSLTKKITDVICKKYNAKIRDF
jgi:phenylalanyl-tRNA synthetase beta subunit